MGTLYLHTNLLFYLQEGRKIWEHILSVSRNLSRIVTLYGKDVGNERLGRIKNLLAAYPYLLRHHIRSGCLCTEPNSIDDQYKLILEEPSKQVVDARYEGDKASGGAYNPSNIGSPRQCVVDRRDLPWSLLEPGSTLRKVARSQNRPLWVCDRLGKELMDVPYTPNYTSRERLSLLSAVDKLTDAIGQCERIHQTAVPLNYARHALRSLTLWLFTLPFCLVKDLGLMTGPVTGIIAWLLFGVYQIGHSIEDPFQGSLRLSILCDAIRRDVLGDEVSRESAFQMDDAWEDDEEEDDFDAALFLPTQVSTDMQNVIASAPKLVQQNGTWQVVGVER
jgi:predicted membrane chloride channel (bestrophin family)